MADDNDSGFNRAQGRKKSNFPAKTTVESGASFDYFLNGVNYKITFADLLPELGATGTIVQEGGTGTPVLDPVGTVNKIRNIQDGSGITASVSPSNGVELDHNFVASSGADRDVFANVTATQPLIRGLTEGNGISLTLDGDNINIASTSAPSTSKLVFISSKDDFPAPSSGVITLDSNTRYQMVDDVNLGTDRIVLQDTTFLTGSGVGVTTLTYTGSGDMLTSSNAAISVESMTISCVSGTVFNISGTTQVCRFEDVVVSQCLNVGTVNGTIPRFTFFTTPNVTGTGITFSGNIPNLLYGPCLINLNAGTMFDLGSATFDSLTLDSVTCGVASGATFISGLTGSGNVNAGGTAQINFCRFSGLGTILNNISADDALWEFTKNDDIPDTRPDGLLSMQGNATNTVISVATTPVLVAGTWTEDLASQFSSTAAGRLTYTGGKDATLPISFSISMSPISGGAQTIAAYVAINGSVVSGSKRTVSTSGGSDLSVTGLWQEKLSTNDYVEVFVANDSATNDILVSSAVFRIN